MDTVDAIIVAAIVITGGYFLYTRVIRPRLNKPKGY